MAEARRGVFITRYVDRCQLCKAPMAKGSAAIKLDHGIACAAHPRPRVDCDHARASWGVCRSCGSPVS